MFSAVPVAKKMTISGSITSFSSGKGEKKRGKKKLKKRKRTVLSAIHVRSGSESHSEKKEFVCTKGPAPSDHDVCT